MKRMKALLIIALSASSFCFAQTHEVEKTVRAFFDAMNKRDTTALKAYISPQISIVTTYINKNDSNVVVYGNIKEFLASVGKKDENTFEEQLFNFNINTAGGLAQIWCDYRFMLNGQLSHCGVDAFHLVLYRGQWKITHLADTRRKTDCDF